MLYVAVVAAVPLLTEAVRRFNAAGLRFDEAYTRPFLAEALLATGGEVVTQRHLALATEVVSELSADGDLAHARRLANAADEPFDGRLSSRELELLRLVSPGLSNPKIAVSLVLSEHTKGEDQMSGPLSTNQFRSITLR